MPELPLLPQILSASALGIKLALLFFFFPWANLLYRAACRCNFSQKSEGFARGKSTLNYITARGGEGIISQA